MLKACWGQNQWWGKIAQAAFPPVTLSIKYYCEITQHSGKESQTLDAERLHSDDLGSEWNFKKFPFPLKLFLKPTTKFISSFEEYFKTFINQN